MLGIRALARGSRKCPSVSRAKSKDEDFHKTKRMMHLRAFALRAARWACPERGRLKPLIDGQLLLLKLRAPKRQLGSPIASRSTTKEDHRLKSVPPNKKTAAQLLCLDDADGLIELEGQHRL